MNNSPNLSIKDKINHFLEYLPTLTKHESDFIKSVIDWDDETKMAFKFAKRMFEDGDENVR